MRNCLTTSMILMMKTRMVSSEDRRRGSDTRQLLCLVSELSYQLGEFTFLR